MARCLVLRLPALPVCLAVVQLLSPCSAQFAVVGPPEPILAFEGEDAELPCHLSPNMSAENMELKWVRTSPRQVVHRYAHGQEDTPAAEYRGRTSILREDITAGKAALQIRDVRASDRGNYLCYFQDGDFFANAEGELKVPGTFFWNVQPWVLALILALILILLVLLGLLVGTCCLLRRQRKKNQALSKEKETERAEKEAAQMEKEAAQAEKEEAQWEKEAAQWEKEAAQREKEAAQAEKEAAQAEKEAAQTEKEAAQAEKEAAQMEKEAAQMEKEAAQAEKEAAQMEKEAAQAEKEAAQWEKEAAQMEKEAAQAEKEAAQMEKEAAQMEKEAAQAERESAQAEKEVAQAKEQRERSAKEKLQDELRWTKIPYLPREEQSKVYAELKRVLFHPADVFLDPDTAHPDLHVPDKRSLNQAGTWQNLPENPKRFHGNECVLGCESFASGRHFWEVDVGDRAQWHIGVCRESVRRKDVTKMAPENGFWMVGLNPGNDYRALTDPHTTLTHVSPPERVGVFLDYELGKVSFYNAIDGAHIFTFPHASFSGPLRPVFGISTFEPTPLTICPAQEAVRRSLVHNPGPDPSLESPVAMGSADGNGDPQAEETSLLLTAQPGAEGLLTSKTSQQEGTEDAEKGATATF